MGNKSNNLTYCSPLQTVVVCNLSEVKGTFSALFRDYVIDR